MNPTVVTQGNQMAAQAYNPVQQGIQAQIPALQNLYTTLVQGLQAQNAAQQQNVLASAQQRGVASPGMAGDIAGQLGGALGQAQAQLGVDIAGGRAGIQSQLAQALADRGNAGITFAQSIQDSNIKKSEQQLALQKAERDFQVAQVAEQTAQAKAAAKAAASAKSLSDLSETAITRQLRLGLNSVMGADGYVSPDNLAKAYALWQNAGLSPQSFWSNFQGLWNPNQGDYNDQFYYSVNRFQKG